MRYASLAFHTLSLLHLMSSSRISVMSLGKESLRDIGQVLQRITTTYAKYSPTRLPLITPFTFKLVFHFTLTIVSKSWMTPMLESFRSSKVSNYRLCNLFVRWAPKSTTQEHTYKTVRHGLTNQYVCAMRKSWYTIKVYDDRDLKIEVWPSYRKRQTAVSGFTLSVCPYLGIKIRGW